MIVSSCSRCHNVGLLRARYHLGIFGDAIVIVGVNARRTRRLQLQRRLMRQRCLSMLMMIIMIMMMITRRIASMMIMMMVVIIVAIGVVI